MTQSINPAQVVGRLALKVVPEDPSNRGLYSFLGGCYFSGWKCAVGAERASGGGGNSFNSLHLLLTPPHAPTRFLFLSLRHRGMKGGAEDSAGQAQKRG